MKLKKGYSVIELLLVLAIIVIPIVIASETFVSSNKNYRILMSYLNSYLKGREALQTMSRDCRVAIRVLDTHAGYITGETCLILKVPSIDLTRNIVDVNNEFDYIIYRLHNNDLWKIVLPGASSARPSMNKIIQKSVQSLTLSHDGQTLNMITHNSVVTSVTMQISLSEEILGNEYMISPGTTVKLMNYDWEFIR